MKIARIVILTIVLGVLAAAAFAAGNGNAAPLVIDVRTEAEWNEGHVEGAVLIPYDRIEEGITAVAPDKNSKIHLYCRSGRRTGIAIETLKKAGYQNLINLGTVEEAAREMHKLIVK
jgi:phage shock protein E